jgi:hypothetical protein
VNLSPTVQCRADVMYRSPSRNEPTARCSRRAQLKGFCRQHYKLCEGTSELAAEDEDPDSVEVYPPADK